MEWYQLYGAGSQPELAQITSFIKNELWIKLCRYLEETYIVIPTIEYSRCSAKPGWNVKYKKSGRSLCTLYPDDGYFTCMISIGVKESAEAELLLTACTPYVRGIYDRANPFNGSRWLMIEVTEEAILTDVMDLIGTRVKAKQKD